jgi:phosphoribosylaminoimidazole-succinocarboxamide synthase
MKPSAQPLHQSDITSLPLLNRGKVRDIYSVGNHHLLIVTTDRVSAFDVILGDPIPEKGKMLTRISNFWFRQLKEIIPNHLDHSLSLEHLLPQSSEYEQARDRSIIVKRLKPLPVEAIVRGYLIGSGWNDYQRTGQVCGITLPEGLKQAEKLPEPLFTPSTKADIGEHDQNIDFETLCTLIEPALAEQIKSVSLRIYQTAAKYALERGIIIADTKFEFGVDESGALYLIDEVLTPDSSRFWPLDSYQTGISPPSFDKQIIRDYLDGLDWNKQAPAPSLPAEVIEKTRAKYQEAVERLCE